MKLYMKKRNNSYDATAEYDVSAKRFVVLKGSRVSDTISASPTFHGTKNIEKLRAENVNNCFVQNDIEFRSASTAANFIAGGSTNGLHTWKDENGKKLKEILSEMKG